jgi:hypothetical protein
MRTLCYTLQRYTHVLQCHVPVIGGILLEWNLPTSLGLLPLAGMRSVYDRFSLVVGCYY